jgi:acyl-CoA hydrolase
MLAAVTAHHDLELLQSLTIGSAPWTDPAFADSLKVNALFLDPQLSELVNAGLDDYTPAHLSDLPGFFRDRVIELDVVLLSVSPPDAHGYCSLGPQVELLPSACAAADWIVAQINPLLPVTPGGSFLRLDEIDFAITAETPLSEWPVVPLEEADRKIGALVAQLIEDGDTIQVGVGRTGTAVLTQLDGHHRLGVHTETIGDGMQRLFEKGVIDNSRKTLVPGKMVATQSLGTSAHYAFLDRNPHVELRPAEFVNNPLTIARNDRMVAVRSALLSDLTGQVAMDSVRGRFCAGMGSQVDFLRGAALSKKGRPIVALRSTSLGESDELLSNIVADLPPGTGVGLGRTDLHYLVTEYGIATLRGRTVQERVAEIIQIAHPDFREELNRQARERRLVPPYFKIVPAYLETEAMLGARKRRLHDGQDYYVRPLNPADDRRLQEFFYSHTEETILRRYGFTVTRMSRKRAYDLVGIDQTRDLALAIFEFQGPRQVIHAVGRYYLDADGTGAEVAFVVSERKRRLGMARVLLDRMFEVAAERGLERLWAQTDADNEPMLRLFRGYGAVQKPSDELHTIIVEMPVKKRAT